MSSFLDAVFAKVAETETTQGFADPSAPTQAEAQDVAKSFVSRELAKSQGNFGRFIVQALRNGLPLRICSSELPSSLRARGNDWSSFHNYLDIAAAYFAYFGQRSHPAFLQIPAFPDREHSWVKSLGRGSKRAVAESLAQAMVKAGRTVRQLSKPPNRGGRNRKVPKAQRRLTVLSMGGGRDSVAMALVLANYSDPWLKKNFPIAARDAQRYRDSNPDLDLLAVFSDTGAEYDFTYSVLDDLEAFLSKKGNGKTGARHPFKLVRINKPSDPKTGKPIEARVIMQAVRGEELVPASLSSNQALANQWWSHAIPGETAIDAAVRGKHHLRPPLYLEHALSGTMTARDNASCTSNQKIVVLDRFVQDLTAERFGVVGPWRQGGHRSTMKRWGDAVKAGQVGRHRRLIGIHAGERGRSDLRTGSRWPQRIVDARSGAKPGMGTNPACKWGRRPGNYTPQKGYGGACYADATNEYHYPLIDWEIDESAEKEILAHYGWDHTRKSGCKHCHWANRGFFWATSKEYPDAFEEAVAMELGNLLRRWIENQHMRGVLQGFKRITPSTLKRRLRNASDSSLDLWSRLAGNAGPRGLEPADFARAVKNGDLPLTRPTTLLPRSLLVCEVAHFAIHEPGATIADVFNAAYKRGGGAVNRLTLATNPARIVGFSNGFLSSARGQAWYK